jgi:hypothetical protein
MAKGRHLKNSDVFIAGKLEFLRENGMVPVHGSIYVAAANPYFAAA